MVEELQAPFDQKLYDAMVAKNEEELKKFDDKATDAEQNQGETEINEAFLSKADYYAQIGDKVRWNKYFLLLYILDSTLKL